MRRIDGGEKTSRRSPGDCWTDGQVHKLQEYYGSYVIISTAPVGQSRSLCWYTLSTTKNEAWKKHKETTGHWCSDEYRKNNYKCVRVRVNVTELHCKKAGGA